MTCFSNAKKAANPPELVDGDPSRTWRGRRPGPELAIEAILMTAGPSELPSPREAGSVPALYLSYTFIFSPWAFLRIDVF